MHSTSLKALNHCISAYACFAQAAQHEDAKGVHAFLFIMVVVVVTTLILHLSVNQNEHAEQGNIFMPKPREVAIDIPNIVSLPGPPSTKNHRPSNNSQDAISPNPTIEMVNNANAAVRDQSHVDMSDTASLLHQDPTRAMATSSFGIENPRNLSPQGEQTSYGVPFQSTAQAPPPIPGNDALTPPPVRVSVPGNDALTPPPVPVPVPVPEAEELDLKNELKVATWVTIISAGGIVSVISGVIGNEKALLPRKLLFKGFMSLNYIALVSGIGLFILIKISPNISGFVRIVKFIMWIAIGSLVYSLGMATCIMFPAKAEIVLILVVPLVIVGLVGILNFAHRE